MDPALRDTSQLSVVFFKLIWWRFSVPVAEKGRKSAKSICYVTNRKKITHTVSVKLVTKISIEQLNHSPLHNTEFIVFPLGPLVLLYVTEEAKY